MANLDSRSILNQIATYAYTSGLFDTVTGHEPRSAPVRTGVSASIWVERYRAAQRTSGLESVSMVLEIQMRVYTSMLQEPADEIDPRILDAVDAMMVGLCGDFELSGSARAVDLMGMESEGLRAEAGYLSQDRAVFRVMDIFIPVIVNDVYAEGA